WLQVQAHRRPQAVAIRRRIAGCWVESRWAELESEVAQLAKMLALRGFGGGDGLILLTRARPEALLLSLAAQWLGGSASMLNPELDTEELRHLLNHLPLRFLFVEDSQQAARIQSLWERRAQPDLLIHAEAGDWRANRLSHQIHYPDLQGQAPQVTLPEQKARAGRDRLYLLSAPGGQDAPDTHPDPPGYRLRRPAGAASPGTQRQGGSPGVPLLRRRRTGPLPAGALADRGVLPEFPGKPGVPGPGSPGTRTDPDPGHPKQLQTAGRPGESAAGTTAVPGPPVGPLGIRPGAAGDTPLPGGPADPPAAGAMAGFRAHP